MGSIESPSMTLVNGAGLVNGTSHTARTGLNVLIAGAGIGGLAAAIALRQRGHHVEVFEQSSFANEIGAAIHLTPNTMGVLRHLGIDPRDSGAVPLLQVCVILPLTALLTLHYIVYHV